MSRSVLGLLAAALFACTVRAPETAPQAPAPAVIDDAREQLLGLLPRPAPILGPEELNCPDEAGELALVAELPRTGSLPARAMWVMPEIGHFPLLLLEPGAEASRADPLKFRRTPDELARLVIHQGFELRKCSDAVREPSPPVFHTRISGLVDPRGRLLEIAAQPIDPREPMQSAFAACVSEELARSSTWAPSLFRHTPGYTRFDFPIRFTGRPDHDKHPVWHCRKPPDDGLGAAGECQATGETIADDLWLADTLVEFVEESRWDLVVAPVRTPPRAREHELATMRAIEGKVAELEACRPDADRLPIEELMIKVDEHKRINQVLGHWDATSECVSAALLGTYLPLEHADEHTWVRLTLLWSSLPLGLAPAEHAMLREHIFQGDQLEPYRERVPELTSLRAAELCPAELLVVHERIADSFGRVGEAAELALYELSLALLVDEPARARACVHEIADALGPVLTWPAPLEGPPVESFGLYEAAARVDTWLMVLTVLDGPKALRDKLGCFLRRADVELMGTLELRDEDSLPSPADCGLEL